MSVCDVIVSTLIGSPPFSLLSSRLRCWTDCHFCCFGAYEDSSARFTLFSALHLDPTLVSALAHRELKLLLFGPPVRCCRQRLVFK